MIIVLNHQFALFVSECQKVHLGKEIPNGIIMIGGSMDNG